MELQRFVAILVCVACSVAGQYPGLAAAARVQVPAQLPAPLTLSGFVVHEDGTIQADQRVRLRSVDKGTVEGETVSDQNGAFSFRLPEPGTYVVEAVNQDGGVLAVSNPITSSTTPFSTSTIPFSTNVVLPADQLAALGFFTSTAFLVTAAAASAGTVAAVVAGGEASAPVSPEQ